MAATSQEGTDNTTPPAPSKYTAWNDLKLDAKSVMNQAVWNAALLYPAYMHDLDSKVFSQRDGDLMSAVKLAGICAGVGEAQKLVRKTLMQAGASPKLVYPFGQPGQ